MAETSKKILNWPKNRLVKWEHLEEVPEGSYRATKVWMYDVRLLATPVPFYLEHLKPDHSQAFFCYIPERTPDGTELPIVTHIYKTKRWYGPDRERVLSTAQQYCNGLERRDITDEPQCEGRPGEYVP